MTLVKSAYRIGLIVPSSNTTMETEIPALLRPLATASPATTFTFHSARVRLRQVTPDALQRMNETAGEAVEALCDAQVDRLLYACLVAAMHGGRSNVVRVSEQLRQRATPNGAGPNVISSAEALVTALRAIGAKRVSLIAPYLPALTERVATTLREYGIDVRDTRSLGVADNVAVGRLDPYRLLDVAAGMNLAGSDALIISACVQMPSLPVIELAESRFGLPVLSAATASVFALLTELGIRRGDARPALAGAGHLLNPQPHYVP